MTGFEVGDVVYDEDEPGTLGIVTHTSDTSVTVVWANGGRVQGPGLLYTLKHVDPRVSLDVPAAALGYHGWNREQAVTAALNRAGLIAGGEKA